jgi:pimeloyl-ACP methyl ester carboxylesterase
MTHGKRRLRFALAALSFCAAAYLLVGWLRPEWVLEAEYARLRWLAGASERSVQVGDHRIVYLQSGRGRTIVLLHGFTGSKENWLPLMRELSGSYRVIAPDLPGWGESTRRRGADYGPVAQSERVREFLLAVQGAAPLAGGGAGTHSAARVAYRPPTLVVGHSMGGQILGLLAASHPDALNRIALMDAAGAPFAPNDFGRAVLAGDNPFEVTSRAGLDRYLGIVFADPPFVPWPADRALSAARAPGRLRAAGARRHRARAGGPAARPAPGTGARADAAAVVPRRSRDRRQRDAVFRAGIRNNRVALLDGCGTCR